MNGVTDRAQESCQFIWPLRSSTQFRMLWRAMHSISLDSLTQRDALCHSKQKHSSVAHACMQLGATHKLAATAYHAAVMIAFLTRSQGGGRARCSRATTLFLRARVTAATRDCVSRLLRRSRRLRISAPSREGSSTSAASPPVPAANMMARI